MIYLIWYLIGFIGCCLYIFVYDKDNITAKNVAIIVVYSCFGPFMILALIIEYFLFGKFR